MRLLSAVSQDDHKKDLPFPDHCDVLLSKGGYPPERGGNKPFPRLLLALGRPFLLRVLDARRLEAAALGIVEDGVLGVLIQARIAY